MDRKLSAILAADVVGYSALVAAGDAHVFLSVRAIL